MFLSSMYFDPIFECSYHLSTSGDEFTRADYPLFSSSCGRTYDREQVLFGDDDRIEEVQWLHYLLHLL
jgi:hypothetical protein